MDGRLGRLGGAALIAGSALLAVVNVTLRLTGGSDGQTHGNPVDVAAYLVGMLAGLLIIVGLPTLVAALGTRAPALSVAGFVLVTVSVLIYEIALGIIDAIVLPYLAAQHLLPSHQPVAMLPFVFGAGFAEIIGNMLLGIAIWRTGLFSRGVAGLLIASGVLLLITLAPIPEWVDTVSALLMLAGYALAGAELAGLTAGARRLAAA